MRWAQFAVALVLGGTASEAAAQASAPAPDAPPEVSFERPIVTTEVYPAECAEREPSDIEAAKGMHRAAKLYFERERYAEAVDAWTASHRFDCTAHRLLLNIATAYERLGDIVGARDALGQYLARAPEPYADGAVEKYRTLSAKPVPRSLPDPTPQPGEPIVPPPEVPLGAWITLGVGAGAAVVGLTLFTVGAVQTEQSCPTDPLACTRAERLDAEQGVTFQHAGGVVAAVGFTAMAVAGVWTWATFDAGTDAEASLSLGPGGAVLSGRF